MSLGLTSASRDGAAEAPARRSQCQPRWSLVPWPPDDGSESPYAAVAKSWLRIGRRRTCNPGFVPADGALKRAPNSPVSVGDSPWSVAFIGLGADGASEQLSAGQTCDQPTGGMEKR